MQTQTQSDTQTAPSLAGRRVALARAVDEAHTPAAGLQALGAEVVFYPCLERLPPANLAEFDQAIQQAADGGYDWLLLPSASAVLALSERLEQLQLKPAHMTENLQIALYGATTRLAAQALLDVDVTQLPDAASHAELVRSLPLQPGARVLLLLAAHQRSDWGVLLAARGAQVTSQAAYRASMGHGGDELPALLWAGAVDAIAFTSEANVRYFAKRLQYEGGTLAMLDHVVVACIEPQTAAAAQALGLRVGVVPQEHTPEALAAGLAAYLARSNR
jgi:uroporphyrinogen-III synthase